MCKKVFITIVILIFIIYFFQQFINDTNIEGFTPKIKSIYRPYIRNLNQKYDNFLDNYNTENIIIKLKKWNIY